MPAKNASRSKGVRWERQVAEAFGAKRNHSDYTTHTDIHAERYAIEVKARKKLPAWMHSAMQQAIDDARGLTPIVVWIESTTGQLPRKYVLIDMDDFLAIDRSIHAAS